MKIISWLQGKKTYITAIMIGLSAGMKAMGHEVPDYVFEVLAALGLMTMRAGVAKATNGSAK